MSKPKYLPIPKKTPYNIRMPQLLLDKLNAYAELTDNTTTDVVISALNDFINDKTVFNDYLPYIKGLSIKIPLVESEKIEMYKVNLIGENSAYDLFNEVLGYEPTTENYEILKIPNNLDRFNKVFGFSTPVNDVVSKGRHSGIEFFIIPEIYGDYGNNSALCTLYCFYFKVEMDKLKSVELINYMDAINKATESGNDTLKNNLIKCVKDLTELDNEIENGTFNGFTDIDDAIIGTIEMTAKVYNTGNIIPLGENIAESVVIDELNNNPELYNVFMDDIKDNTEKYVDEVIAERIHNIIDYRLSASGIDDKSRDDILNDIKNANFKTKK